MTGTHGEYRLLGRIAVGGMAELFRAKLCGLEGFERVVAVKRILPEYSGDRQFIDMFLDEARIAAKLSHPNIVQTIDLCSSEDGYFIVMEMVEGVDVLRVLRHCRKTGSPIPRRHACRIVSELCAGLAYAHSRRDGNCRMDIVHRDVSPANVLISNSGEVKLIDFGVAKAARARSRTIAGTLKGKMGYLSPEQALGDSIDHRTDIFAAGIVLWELLTVSRLFYGSTQKVLDQILRRTPPPPSSRNPSVPKELDAIVAKALARNPDDRYQDAAELHDRLCRYMESSGEQSNASSLATWTTRVMMADTDPVDPPTLLVAPKPSPEPPPVTVTFVENPGKVFVDFDSQPRGARVVVVSDGVAQRIGRTPVRWLLDRGTSYHVSMRKTGYAMWSGRRSFDVQRSPRVSANLRPNPTKRDFERYGETPT